MKPVSIITKTSAENLALKRGKEVHAVSKDGNAIIATD
jgi:molybdopterin-binding protein